MYLICIYNNRYLLQNIFLSNKKICYYCLLVTYLITVYILDELIIHGIIEIK